MRRVVIYLARASRPHRWAPRICQRRNISVPPPRDAEDPQSRLLQYIDGTSNNDGKEREVSYALPDDWLQQLSSCKEGSSLVTLLDDAHAATSHDHDMLGHLAMECMRYARHWGELGAAEAIFTWMLDHNIEPDGPTLLRLSDAYALAGQGARAYRLLADAEAAGLPFFSEAYSLLLYRSASNGDTATYSAAMDRLRKALGPSAMSMPAALASRIRRAGRYRDWKEVHSLIRKAGTVADQLPAGAWASVAEAASHLEDKDLLRECERVAEARGWVRLRRTASRAWFRLSVRSASSREEAERAVAHVRAGGWSSATAVIVIQKCTEEGWYDLGWKWWREWKGDGFRMLRPLSSQLFGALARMCAHAMDEASLAEVVATFRAHGVTEDRAVFNNLLAAMEGRGDLDQALLLVRTMRRSGEELDRVGVAHVFRLFLRNGDIRGALLFLSRFRHVMERRTCARLTLDVMHAAAALQGDVEAALGDSLGQDPPSLPRPQLASVIVAAAAFLKEELNTPVPHRLQPLVGRCQAMMEPHDDTGVTTA